MPHVRVNPLSALDHRVIHNKINIQTLKDVDPQSELKKFCKNQTFAEKIVFLQASVYLQNTNVKEFCFLLQIQLTTLTTQH